MFKSTTVPAKLCKLDKELIFASDKTINLVRDLVTGGKNLSKNLTKYKWSGTRDFNMAVIIIAFIYYFLKFGNNKLKGTAKEAIRKIDIDSNKSALNALIHGNGQQIAKDLENTIFTTEVQKLIFGVPNTAVKNVDINKNDDDDDIVVTKNGKVLTQEEFENMLNKIFKNGLFKQAAKIKPWKINGRNVHYLVHLLKGDTQIEIIQDQGNTYTDAINKEITEKLNLKQEYEKAWTELRNRWDQFGKKTEQQIRELTEERKNLQNKLNDATLEIEEQKKQIQELKAKQEEKKANLKLLFNNFMKETNEIIQKNTNLNKEEVKEVKEKTKKLQKTLDDFALKAAKPFILSNGESFAPNINKTRRKSMGDKSLPYITPKTLEDAKAHLKQVGENLKSLKSVTKNNNSSK